MTTRSAARMVALIRPSSGVDRTVTDCPLLVSFLSGNAEVPISEDGRDERESPRHPRPPDEDPLRLMLQGLIAAVLVPVENGILQSVRFGRFGGPSQRSERKMPPKSRRSDVRAGAKLEGSLFIGTASRSPGSASQATSDADADAGTARAIGFFPEWGRASPLWGGDSLESLRLPGGLVERLTAWTLVWQSQFDELQGAWLDAAVGVGWIAEGEALLSEVRAHAGLIGLEVAADPDSHEYAPRKR
jgi:hypothetical protein